MRSRQAILIFGQGPRQESRRKAFSPDAALGRTAASALLSHSILNARASGVDVLLAGDAELAARPPGGVILLRQRGSGFGERLRNATADAFALGYQRLLIVGTDTPGLIPALYRTAFEELARGTDRTVVIGPSRDGGYYLLGLNRFDARAFAGIPWRTGRVLASTRRALSGCRVILLPLLTDADDASTLRRALREANHVEAMRSLLILLTRSSAPAVRRASINPGTAAGRSILRRGPPRLSA